MLVEGLDLGSPKITIILLYLYKERSIKIKLNDMSYTRLTLTRQDIDTTQIKNDPWLTYSLLASNDATLHLYFYRDVLYARVLKTIIHYENGNVANYLTSEAGPMNQDEFPNMSSESWFESRKQVLYIKSHGKLRMKRYHKSLALKTKTMLKQNGIAPDAGVRNHCTLPGRFAIFIGLVLLFMIFATAMVWFNFLLR